MKRLIILSAVILPTLGTIATVAAADSPLGQSVHTLITEQTANPLAGLADPEMLPPTEGMHTDKVVNAYQQKKPANTRAVSGRGALSLGSRR